MIRLTRSTRRDSPRSVLLSLRIEVYRSPLLLRTGLQRTKRHKRTGPVALYLPGTRRPTVPDRKGGVDGKGYSRNGRPRFLGPKLNLTEAVVLRDRSETKGHPLIRTRRADQKHPGPGEEKTHKGVPQVPEVPVLRPSTTNVSGGP